LSGNLITEKGLEFLSGKLGGLEELNLSFNPLRNCFRVLGSFLADSKLVRLAVRSCEIQDFSGKERDLNFGGLKELDVSYNQFSGDAIEILMGKLNPHGIEVLNLEAATTAGDLELSVGGWTALREIRLGKLSLSETGILEILRNLEGCENLKILDLSYLNEVSFMTLKFILSSEKFKLEKLKMLGCKNLKNLGNLVNPLGQDLKKYPRNFFLSMARNWSEEEMTSFKDNLKEVWDNHGGHYGRIKVWKNIVKLYVECEEQEDDFPGDLIK
jgi:hypothetical protein